MMQFWREIQISGDPDGPDPPDGAGAAGVHLGKSGLASGSILCIIRLYLVLFGGGDGGYLNLGVGAGVRVDQAEVRTPL